MHVAVNGIGFTYFSVSTCVLLCPRFAKTKNNMSIKINHFTNFDAMMDVKNVVFDAVDTVTNYELEAVICHSNVGFSSGHYVVGSTIIM